MKHEREFKNSVLKDRRGDTTGGGPGCPFDSIDTISFSNMLIREEFTPWTMIFVEVTCIISVFCFSLSPHHEIARGVLYILGLRSR
jgi:hypothetical protein